MAGIEFVTIHFGAYDKYLYSVYSVCGVYCVYCVHCVHCVYSVFDFPLSLVPSPSLVYSRCIHAILTLFPRPSQSLNAQALTSDPLLSLMTLLRIICDGSISEFSTFKNTKGAVMKQHNLNVDSIEHSLRLLALCSLAARSSEKVLSFAAIKEVLGCVDDEEAEVWVIEAISENLLSASIDQLSGTGIYTVPYYPSYLIPLPYCPSYLIPLLYYLSCSHCK